MNIFEEILLSQEGKERERKRDKESEKEQEREERIVSRYYYDIDIQKNLDIETPEKEFFSSFFRVCSSEIQTIEKYYFNNFGIEFSDEKELLRRIHNRKKSGMFRIIDPFHQYDFVNPKKKGIHNWKYRSDFFQIVSNNRKLFSSAVEILEYLSNGILARLGMLKYIEERRIGEWYFLDIRKHIHFEVKNSPKEGIVSIVKEDKTIYYSFIHKLWGFDFENFKSVYRLLIGHDYNHQDTIELRLKKTKDNDFYAVVEPFSKKLKIVDDIKKAKYKYISENVRIVSNDQILFQNYEISSLFYRKGYRLHT